jgi:hypothetical protein
VTTSVSGGDVKKHAPILFKSAIRNVLTPGSWILNSKHTLLRIRGRDARRGHENYVSF